MPLHANDTVLPSWEEQMVWFPPNTSNSRFFAFSPMIFVLKLLSWSSKLGARWTYHLNHTNLLQKEFWKILHDFYLFIYLYKVTNEEFKTSQNDGINLYFMLIDLLQLPLQMYFNENLEKNQYGLQEKKIGSFLKNLLQWHLLINVASRGREEQSHRRHSVWLYFVLLRKCNETHPGKGTAGLPLVLGPQHWRHLLVCYLLQASRSFSLSKH